MDGIGSAQGAVDSLLGTLASLIKDEAQLLGNVRDDVQFISDEMESMNGFLLHVDEATEEDDHQVRAWMKQVKDVAVESERWVDRYLRWEGTTPRGGGLLGSVRRIPHSLWTISERHKIATKIQELKSRAHQVGERRQRYGVEVPSKKDRKVQDARSRLGREDEMEEQYAWRRCLEALLGEGPEKHDMTEEDKNNIVRQLLKEEQDMYVNIIPVAGLSDTGVNILKTQVFQSSSVENHFDGMLLWTPVPRSILDGGMEELIGDKLLSILYSRYLYRVQPNAPATGDEKYLPLKGKKFLIVLETGKSFGKEHRSYWTDDCYQILRTAWLARSVIIVLVDGIAERFLGSESFNFTNPLNIQVNRAIALVERTRTEKQAQVLTNIIHKLLEDTKCLKMLFHILHLNPNRALEKLQFLSHGLKMVSRSILWMYPDDSPDNASQLLLFSYRDLPNDSKRCLLYMAIFPPGFRIRRTCLVRRWVAEGLITRRAGLSALDAADRCFGALVDEGLLQCVEPGLAGKVKFVMVPPALHEINMQAAIAQDFEGLHLPRYMGIFVSIGAGIQWAPKVQRRRDSFLQSIIRICTCKGGVPAAAQYPDPIVTLLESLPRFERNGLLKLLDLANVTGLRNKHLMKNICEVSELRYLNLRGSDVTELPEEIHKMQNLETLDIRQTKVKVLPSKVVFLRNLKHMLSGSIESFQPTVAGNDLEFNELFSAVGMPHEIGNMTALQIMSHVEVSSGSDRLINDFNQLIRKFERLQKLRKLGVVVRGRTPHLRSLLQEIGKLDKSLRSLSIQFKQPAEDNHDTVDGMGMITLPRLLESLKLSGFRDGLPSWVLKLSKLVKVTLQDTFLKMGDLRGLAKLDSLCGLRLRFVKYSREDNEAYLHIRKEEFKSLKNLLLEHTNITDISFDEGAAPKLKKMYWKSNKVNSISGVGYLKEVTEIGFLDCIVDHSVTTAIRGTIFTGRYITNFYDWVTRDGVPQDRGMVPDER